MASDDPRWTAVEHYVLQHLHPSTGDRAAALDYACKNSEAHGLPEIAVQPPLGKFLHLQLRALQARRALEVGTLGGYSAIWLAHGLPTLQLVTLEVDAKHAAVARSNLAHAGLDSNVEVRLAPALESLAVLEKEITDGKADKFDFVFIDADKQNNWKYFDAAVRMSRQGTVIIVDNVVRQGRLCDGKAAETDEYLAGARKLVETVGRDARVEATVLQMVSEKNYDGILIATVL